MLTEAERLERADQRHAEAVKRFQEAQAYAFANIHGGNFAMRPQIRPRSEFQRYLALQLSDLKAWRKEFALKPQPEYGGYEDWRGKKKGTPCKLVEQVGDGFCFGNEPSAIGGTVYERPGYEPFRLRGKWYWRPK
jgi:hypothetical protein